MDLLSGQAPLCILLANGLSGRFRLSLNGKAAGEFESEDLSKGVRINTEGFEMA